MKADPEPLDRVLAALDIKRTKATQYSAHCPAHDDNSPSLSIGVQEDGTVGLRCQAKCKTDNVVAAMGLTMADLFPSKGRAKPAKVKQKPTPTAKTKPPKPITNAELDEAWDEAVKLCPRGFNLVTIYPYRDASAEMWSWRARYENPKTGKKKIYPFHHDGSDWVLKEPTAPRAGKPLYRLPEVLAAADPVFIVEGEKCADALAARDIATTTSGGGSSNASKADWTPLAGRTCVIWPDNDDPGAQYAADVSGILQNLDCDVAVIDVPALDLPDKGDAADWLATNATATAADVLALPTVEPEKQESPADTLFQNLVPLGPDVWAAADTPHPHLFQQDHVGIFPVGEVTVIGSPGRTGKTTILVAMATRHLLGEPLGGLPPTGQGPIVVLSAEDTPTQFARKLKAVKHFIKAADWSKVEQGFIVPDFDAPTLAQLRQLVSIDRGQPAVAPEVATMVDALHRLQSAKGIGVIFIETASTWNAANEDNPSFRALIAAAKEIARSLNVAVVLTHHVSQSSGSNLSKLDLSVADLRGGTTFVDNSRQVALLVNLGSDDNPFPDDDARTVLRRMAAPNLAGKLSALVFLNSSQGDDVPPIFFEWISTEHGPACVEVTPASGLKGLKWYAVRSVLNAARPLKASSDKAAKLDEVVAIVNQMHKARKHGGPAPTARAVSKHAGHSDSWAGDALKQAIADGLLTCSEESVPRAKGKVDVYQPAKP